ncbi:glycosyltransferase [Actinomycetospora sp. TBRC 11914]|uniref:glycosyltransferase n=1 Tax=Actinomycetospora sp. TBRC 11914 TaxID=2729387 RepID=UPI00145EA05D|nr:glycosyltransferase [Actinomycetospora sp. TBRC 11914]NMO90669.1 glycosyltransferase [Actinomycetospora sp. TBRC 11914]
MLTATATTTPTPVPAVSVVIPTFDEAGNVGELLRRLAEALPAGAEVVVVDDSSDDTAALARAAAPFLPFALTVIHRDEPTGGLGGAVVEGLRVARAEWAVVMDGDLQHPPAVVADLLAAAPGHDVVVATRYAAGGDGSGLGSPYRHAVSRGSKVLAARLLGGAVARMSDPLSGFFAVRRAALDLDAVDPIGYKILLELVVRSRLERIAEVPFTFGTRHAEESKSTAREGLRFLRHLRVLRRAQRVVTPAAAPIRLDDHRRDRRNPRLDVLIVTSEAPPIVSGISRCVDRLTVGLRERGHRVDVLSSVQIPRLVLGEYRFSTLAAHWRRVTALLDDYDVVNLHGPVPTMSDVVLLLAGARRGTPILYTHHSALAVRGAETASRVYNRLHRVLSGRADRILTTSEHYAGLERRAGGPPVEVVPWGVDVRPRPLRPHRDGAPLKVLFVGQMRPYKGLEWLIPAVAGRPGLALTLVGDGPHRREYELLAGSAPNVLFTGRISDDDLHRAYDTHDVVVLPSVTQAEAFGLVVLEGMAAGCVPVVSDLPGVRDLVADTGLVVPARDTDALAAALDGLAADRPRLTALGHRARRRAEGLGWDTCVERYEAAMTATVADRGRVLPTTPAAARPSITRAG